MILILIILLSTPFWGALVHDIWLLKKNTGGLNWDELVFSDVGWLWVTYHEASYNKYIKTWDADFWNTYIDPVLNQDAYLVGGGLSLVLMLIFIPLHLKGSKSSNDVSALDSDNGFSFSSVRKDMDKGQL